MIGENPIEPLQKLEFLRSFRPGPVIKAAARHREQRALPGYGQPRFRRDHRPPLTLGRWPAAGTKIALDLQLPDLAVQIVDHLLRSAGALLPRANSSPARVISSCFQLLIIVG